MQENYHKSLKKTTTRAQKNPTRVLKNYHISAKETIIQAQKKCYKNAKEML